MIGLPFVERSHREAPGPHPGRTEPQGWHPHAAQGFGHEAEPGLDHRPNPRARAQGSGRPPQADLGVLRHNTFGRLAKKYEVVLVAPSAWLWDPVDGRMRNIACVYDRDGSRVGYQAKVLVSRNERKLARPGTGWQPIETSIGNIGLALGHDALVPEVGRLFASRGASVLVSQLACRTDLEWGRAHRATLMRCMENQLFGRGQLPGGEGPARPGSRGGRALPRPFHDAGPD